MNNSSRIISLSEEIKIQAQILLKRLILPTISLKLMRWQNCGLFKSINLGVSCRRYPAQTLSGIFCR